MKKFLRLHNYDTNSIVVINIDHITCIDTVEYGKRVCGIIFLDDSAGIQEFTVNESPEKIYQMINELNN